MDRLKGNRPIFRNQYVKKPSDIKTLEGDYLFTGVVSVTLNFHPQGRNVNDVTNEGKG